MTRLLTILLLLTGSLFASESKGFDGISFGLDQERVVEEVFKKGYTPEEHPGMVLVPIYKLGDLPVEVIFRFNHQGRFFSYEMRTGAVEKDRFDKVIEAVRYMSEQLSTRFGQPIKKNFYRIEEIEGKKAAPYWLWDDHDVDVATYIKPKDARFYCQGTVTQKQLAREQ
ncbi:MAG TPA: hypothetical protein VLM37_00330 [Fibrobacteraceae bacterium]|nr:hypothetical protein [Fibrobacteraceae bacterium]